MTDLPDATISNTPPLPPSGTPMSVTPGGKEGSAGMVALPEGLRDATGQELELPKEVAGAGVKVTPTVIPIPQSVANMGVKPAGQNIPTQTTSTVVLPINDDQIVVGLHQGVVSSWRWLSIWCVKQLKRLHIAIQSVGGKNTRVQI
jgi:hypothetical protein